MCARAGVGLADASGPLDGGAATYRRGSRASRSGGARLATYTWEPAGARPLRGRVLLLHGFRSHARYNFLANAPGALHAYGGAGARAGGAPSSFVRELVRRGFSVHAHDHVGHGDSPGLRAYFARFSVLVDDAVAHARALASGHGSHHTPWDDDPGWGPAEEAAYNDSRGFPPEQRDLPLYVCGHSMGGAVAILASLRAPDLFQGMMLSSAATEPPAKYTGTFASAWYGLAVAASTVLPSVELIPMDKNTRLPEMQALFESDPLNLQTGIRGRVGFEFMEAYARIAASLHDVTTPFLTMSGKHDTLVHPAASERFFQGAAAADKQLSVREDNWHNLLTEPGKEENWRLYVEWLDARAPAVSAASG